MTVYEHAMVGICGALATGLDRRYGWQLVAWAGFASVLPDFDGLTILGGPQLYTEAHRLWTHNLLVAGLSAAILSVVAFETDAPTRIRNWLAKRRGLSLFSPGATQREPSRRGRDVWVWVAVGIAAAYGHLLIDVIYSAGRGLPIWGVPLLWPFSYVEYDYPVFPCWGDVGATLIFAAAMFAMLRWRDWIHVIAAGSLAAVAAYVVIRGCLG
jgi:membrane-bound metal-dependent hydrolase YbcI (DUF457 family)